jgi:N-carbamoylputrescine amidase
VCADVLYPEAARILALQGAEILINPVLSPFREVDNTKEARDAIFIARAYDSGAFVLKAGGFRRGAIAGRSLVAAPWGLVARYADDFAEALLVADLDFERLHDFRKHQASFPARRPEAYEGLL